MRCGVCGREINRGAACEVCKDNSPLEAETVRLASDVGPCPVCDDISQIEGCSNCGAPSSEDMEAFSKWIEYK